MALLSDQVLLFHTMRVVASVDGRFGDEEAALVRGVLATLPDFADADLDRVSEGSSKLAAKYKGLLESTEALEGLSTRSQKRKAYLLALEVAYASDGISKLERELLSALRAVLGIDAAAGKSIQDVVAIKYSRPDN